jgi:hypothetical protein
MVFIGGVRQCYGQRLGMWGPLVRLGGHATWPGDQVSSLHRLCALDTLSTASSGHVDKMVFGNAPTHHRPTTLRFPRVIFLVTISYFGHNVDMHGF